ncbi:MAG: cytidylate kinase family protein [Deltaproteobacteria bacterium]|nr:cytidylate kinase family protein [Deltaproteobacteria bacterium]
MSLITITSSMGTGGITISRQVADALNLELYDDQRLQEEAEKIGISPEHIESLDEKAPGLFSRLLSYKPQAYVDLVQAVVYGVARRGEGVIFGHGAQFLVRDFGCALQVRLYASFPTRIQYLMDKQGMSREAAEKIIQKSDSDRRGFQQYAFHMDWNDPSLYDLIINRDKLSIDSAAKLIIEVAQSQEIKECSISAADTMERLSLGKKIEAEMLKNNFSPLQFHVEVPEKGKALLTGWTRSVENRDRLLQIVKGVQGVSEITSEIAVVTLVGE